MKIKTQSKTILFSRDRRGGERDGRRGRGKEVRIKDKVGIERTETLVFRMCLRLDYPNLQQQVLIPPTIEKTNAVTHCLRNHKSQHFFMFKISEPAGRQKQAVINNTQIELQASDRLLKHHCSHKPV